MNPSNQSSGRRTPFGTCGTIEHLGYVTTECNGPKVVAVHDELVGQGLISTVPNTLKRKNIDCQFGFGKWPLLCK